MWLLCSVMGPKYKDQAQSLRKLQITIIITIFLFLVLRHQTEQAVQRLAENYQETFGQIYRLV